MKKYECLYIIHPDADGEGVSRAVKKVEDTLKAAGGEPVNVQHWGKRKLAYFIDKQRFGSYVLMHFQGEAPDVAGFQREIEIDDMVLAYMTIRLDEFPDFATLAIPQSFDAERPRRSAPAGGRRPRYRDEEEGEDIDVSDLVAPEPPAKEAAVEDSTATATDDEKPAEDAVIEEAPVDEAATEEPVAEEPVAVEVKEQTEPAEEAEPAEEVAPAEEATPEETPAEEAPATEAEEEEAAEEKQPKEGE